MDGTIGFVAVEVGWDAAVGIVNVGASILIGLAVSIFGKSVATGFGTLGLDGVASTLISGNGRDGGAGVGVGVGVGVVVGVTVGGAVNFETSGNAIVGGIGGAEPLTVASSGSLISDVFTSETAGGVGGLDPPVGTNSGSGKWNAPGLVGVLVEAGFDSLRGVDELLESFSGGSAMEVVGVSFAGTIGVETNGTTEIVSTFGVLGCVS